MRLRIFIKYALYTLVFLCVFAFQSAFGRKLTVLGVRPDFMPALVACTAIFERVLPAAFLGLWAGILCDTISVSGLFFSLFYYFAAAGIAHICRRRFYPHPVIALGALAVILLLSQGLCYVFYYLPFYGAPASRLLRIILVESGFCIPAFYPFFFLCRKLHTLAPQPYAAKPVRASLIKPARRITRLALSGGGMQRRQHEKQ